jgi:hypothetical protein
MFPISRAFRRRGDFKVKSANLETAPAATLKRYSAPACTSCEENDNNTSPAFRPVKMGRKSSFGCRSVADRSRFPLNPIWHFRDSMLAQLLPGFRFTPIPKTNPQFAANPLLNQGNLKP